VLLSGFCFVLGMYNIDNGGYLRSVQVAINHHFPAFPAFLLCSMSIGDLEELPRASAPLFHHLICKSTILVRPCSVLNYYVCYICPSRVALARQGPVSSSFEKWEILIWHRKRSNSRMLLTFFVCCCCIC
jgi:hypothetical protein